MATQNHTAKHSAGGTLRPIDGLLKTSDGRVRRVGRARLKLRNRVARFSEAIAQAYGCALGGLHG